MASPEAGGIITDVIGAASTVQLTDVRRFTTPWEGPASLQLRDGHTHIAGTYDTHQRIIGVTADTANARIVTDWFTDRQAGLDTVIVADTNAEAGELAALAQTLLRDAGLVQAGVVELMYHNLSCIGDIIQTRRNDADLIASDGRRVANRDTWRVLSAGPDGVIAQRANSSAATVEFPLRYLAHHAQLAYAGTIHAVQGRTVDGCRALITPTTGASALYVGMTRGRHTNTAYCHTDGHDHHEHGTGHLDPTAAFQAAMRRDDREHSARSTLRDTLNKESSIATLQMQLAETARLAASETWHSWANHHLKPHQLARIGNDPDRGRIIEALATLVGRADLGRSLTTATAEVDWRHDDLARRVAGAIYDYRDRQGTAAQPHVLDPDRSWRPLVDASLLERHVVELHDAIQERSRMLSAGAAAALPPWWPTGVPHDVDLAGDIAVYRDTWGLTDEADALGDTPADTAGRRLSEWTVLRRRLMEVVDHSLADDHALNFAEALSTLRTWNSERAASAAVGHRPPQMEHDLAASWGAEP